MTQNYLFIDIDGPLLPGRLHLFPGNREFLHAFNDGVKPPELFEQTPVKFDEWGVRAHNLLAKYGNAKVVIVTNWRRWCSIEQLQDLFAEQGLEFEYADQPNCAVRGMSSERYHDIACHMEDYIEEDARCLIIDDYNLQALNLFYRLEGEEGDRSDSDDWGTAWRGPKHDDMQVGIVQNREGSVEHDIRFKWLNVDFNNGLTVEQFKMGADFFGIDWDQLNYHEFGIPIKTEEEKQKEREDFDRLYHALIV
jgi:hypothetical protein